ncbi:hypothetical protein [uncultured Umboniibacter sp.]|uniref:hypothetical protein n=1 Tax=uncultured Umboniibacter sp. TaxID=1798917 RepID=UPI002636D410|nr:hypothetical protein [uncultured Umboniibacter sp.]
MLLRIRHYSFSILLAAVVTIASLNGCVYHEYDPENESDYAQFWCEPANRAAIQGYRPPEPGEDLDVSYQQCMETYRDQLPPEIQAEKSD